jgi:iron(III) transport system substrate-binding protein
VKQLSGSFDRRQLLVSCGVGAVSAAFGCRKTSSNDVVVYTSVDQVFSEPIFRTAEQRVGTHVRAVFDTEETKSTGVLNRLIAESHTPQADVFWSGDPMRPFELIRRGLVEPYVSKEASGLPREARAPDGMWTGIAARARVLLLNKRRVTSIDAPTGLRDLIDPRWKGQAAIASPLFGTTTMHVAALFSVWGEDKAKDFLEAVRKNDVRIASSNGEVKRLVSGGEVAFGLTDTDDANEAVKDGAPVDVVYPDQDGLGTLVMPTSVVLMRRGPHPEAGRKLIDYLLSAEVERRMAEAAAHMPLRTGVPTPHNVRPVSTIRTMNVDYATLAREIQRIQPWLRAWAGL